ncbi:MAG: NAD(+)/NADH kinase [Clostridia bacterium]|nr:NAD(+)/NADH kinase [Clostridia bacterium]
MKVKVIRNYIKDKDSKETEKLLKILKDRNIEIDDKEEKISEDTDVVIVLGGDGTILATACECAEKEIPVMGINLGRVGFMTETDKGSMEKAIDALLANRYKIEERMMMDIFIASDSGERSYSALNDLVVSKPDSQMISVGIFAEEEKITEYIADGVIIATPTGSTGYSLSAGGPVADPATEMFLATPVCAHTLKARPAVLAPEKEVTVKLFGGANPFGAVSVDGVLREKIEEGECVKIKKSDKKLKIIKFGNQSFYDILTAKLL